MATTKIWSVKNRLDHVLEYVSNEDKTIDKLGSYVSRNEAMVLRQEKGLIK